MQILTKSRSVIRPQNELFFAHLSGEKRSESTLKFSFGRKPTSSVKNQCVKGGLYRTSYVLVVFSPELSTVVRASETKGYQMQCGEAKIMDVG